MGPLNPSDIKMFRATDIIYDNVLKILNDTFLLKSDNPTGLFRTIDSALDWRLIDNLPVDKFPWAILEFVEIGRVEEEQAPDVFTYPLRLAMVMMTYADRGNQEYLVRNPNFELGQSYEDQESGGKNKNPGVMDLYKVVAGYFWGYRHTQELSIFGIPRNNQVDYGIQRWTFERIGIPTVPAVQGMLVDPMFRGVQADFTFLVRERNDFF